MGALTGLLMGVALVASLPDPAQEARARNLEREIRCVQCVAEPIAQSNAPIALDMRRILRDQIAAGASDNEVRAFFADRYGEGVLYRPRLNLQSWALWAFPFGLLAAIIGFLAQRAKTRAAPSLMVEDAQAEAALAALETRQE